MIACQSENNIAVVGKEQVVIGYTTWIRVDANTYQGDRVYRKHLPARPLHAMRKTPREVVCPVGATNHSTEGLNDMVYNRCVGTRYCSNNCPYKVRRFNFLLFFQDWDTPQYKMMRNPTSACAAAASWKNSTHCIQRRINERRIDVETKRCAKKTRRKNIWISATNSKPPASNPSRRRHRLRQHQRPTIKRQVKSAVQKTTALWRRIKIRARAQRTWQKEQTRTPETKG